MTELRTKVERNLGRGLLALLFIGCLRVLWPFVPSLLWATVLAFSLWPLYSRLAKLLGGRRTLTAVVLSLILVVAGVLPFAIVGLTLGDNVTQLKAATRQWLDAGPPAAPAWLAKIPLVGQTATKSWNDLASDSAALVEKAKDLIEPVASWLLKAGLKLGFGLFQLALSVLLAFFLLKDGESFAKSLTDAIFRIGGEHAKHLLLVAGNTVRGVVYGILGTALVQAVMAGVGLVIAGVPGAGVLALLTFFLSVVPLGPPLVLLPAAFWLFHQGSTGWGVFMVVWAVLVSTVDNFVKPWLISQGSDMPFILILFGVLGGAWAFGFIGVFLGPTLLAVGHRLVREWATGNRASTDPDAPPASDSKQSPATN